MAVRNGSRKGPAGMSSLSVVVVGGSLGGLLAANALRRHGFHVTVLERSVQPLRDQGAGIRVQPAMVRFMEDVLGRDIMSFAASIQTRRYIDRSGAVVHEVDEPGACTHWGHLFAALSAGDHGEYLLGRSVVDLSQDEDGVQLRLADDSSISADLVVFADGTGSTGRQLLFPGLTAQPVGYVAWRGAVEEGRLPSEFVASCDGALTIYLTTGSHIHVYPVPGRSGSTERGERLLNFVWYRNVPDDGSLDELMTDGQGRRRILSVRHSDLRPAVVAEVHDAAQRTLPPQVATLVESSDVFVQSVVEVSVPRMVDGRVALLGDAAFVARPHAGAGTAKAADNALALAAALGTHGNVADALRDWEVGELERGRDLVTRSAAIGELYQHQGTYPGDPRLETLARSIHWIE